MRVIIKTSDSFGEKNQEIVSCNKEIKEKGRMYSYKNELGDSKIFVLQDRVQIMRSGQIKSNQTIKLDEDTRFNYKTPYMQKAFILKTEELVIKEDRINARYSIYEYEEKVNTITLEIKEID